MTTAEYLLRVRRHIEAGRLDGEGWSELLDLVLAAYEDGGTTYIDRQVFNAEELKSMGYEVEVSWARKP